MSAEITVTQREAGTVTVDYGGGRTEEYPSMAEAMKAAGKEAAQAGKVVRVVKPD